jgi:hypothetical protein
MASLRRGLSPIRNQYRTIDAMIFCKFVSSVKNTIQSVMMLAAFGAKIGWPIWRKLAGELAISDDGADLRGVRAWPRLDDALARAAGSQGGTRGNDTNRTIASGAMGG